MTKLKLLSASGAGVIAIAPFALLIPKTNLKQNLISFSSSRNRKSKDHLSFFESDKSEGSMSESLLQTNKNQDYQVATSNQEIKVDKNQESNLTPELLPGGAHKSTPKLKKEVNLNKWLTSISPLLSGEGAQKPFTIIARWDGGWTFVIIKWDPTCQCFRHLDSNYGIWTNKRGLFTIAHKSASEQIKKESFIETLECRDFSSFWYQGWNTWWRLKNWLKTMNTNKTSHTAIASCYKEPVIFLQTGFNIPSFGFTKNIGPRSYIKLAGDREIAWDYESNQFVTSALDFKGFPNIVKIRNYLDWKNLWKI